LLDSLLQEKMRLLICLAAVVGLSAAVSYRDGAEYDEDGSRIHHRRVQSYRPEHQQQQQQFRYRRQNRPAGPVYRFQKPKGRPQGKKTTRPLRPVQKQEAPRYVAESSNRRENIFVPQNQRPLRPVENERYEEYPELENIVPTYPELKRSDSPAYSQRSPPLQRGEAERSREPTRQQAADPYRAEPYRPKEQARKQAPKPYRSSEPYKSIDRVYTEPEKKVFVRNADQAQDQLEGESFQPAYTPYNAPPTAYDAGYVPPEQKSIEAAVSAGAAAYNKEGYKEPERLSFQIHGQEGPNSYRFGYDTGVGYNRQFRYEERDNAGVLHGRYGYYDQAGKLQIVNYTADPVGGFNAEGEHVPKPEY